MALVVNDRVRESTTVVGTGTATLLGAALGYQSFAVIGNANTTYYCIADQGASNWEVGIGTYTSSGTTLARTAVLASSNGGALVVFTAGVKDVFVTYPSEKGVWYDASGNILFTGTTTATNLAYTGTLTGSTGIIAIGTNQIYKDASGNVGIGTSSSSSYISGGGLVVAQSSSGGEVIPFALINPNGTSGTQVSLAFTPNTNIPLAKISAIRTAGSGTTDLTFNNYGGSPLQMRETMRIDSSGNVGIGNIPSGTYKLEVTGAIGASTTVTAPELLASNGLVLNNKTVSTSYTFPTGYNASSVGAITINSGVTVTVPSGQRWVVL
jgi:hypothetical protein